MRLLLDTHAFVWALLDLSQLSRAALHALSDPANTVFVSSVSAWELAIKHRSGKFPEIAVILDQYYEVLAKAQFTELIISSAHGIAAGTLEWSHKDPFDRLLVVQAVMEDCVLVTMDQTITDANLVKVLW